MHFGGQVEEAKSYMGNGIIFVGFTSLFEGEAAANSVFGLYVSK